MPPASPPKSFAGSSVAPNVARRASARSRKRRYRSPRRRPAPIRGSRGRSIRHRPARASISQGSATQSAPKAVHCGSRSRSAARPEDDAPRRGEQCRRRARERRAPRPQPRRGRRRPARCRSGRNWPPRQSRPHSQAITAAAAAVNSGSQGDPNQIAATGSGANTTPRDARAVPIASPAQREPMEVP